ncbi:hypothetical protein CVT26_001543 [Gymnopilus dilepis]|uniref:Uncharacterized protein n=1 Tax=Gymnopilus dilepis TaxID=231916 RepID=A0A409WW07_9AGAR|nr:hypothetical protein CVT26_001543 [Gymnopilus dilepis]
MAFFSPALPLDIFTTIIEFLGPFEVEVEVDDDDDLHALRALSLSCKLLTPLCQRAIFKRVNLCNRRLYNPRSWGPAPLIQPFAELVSSSTSKHLGTYVLHLSYQAQGGEWTSFYLSTILPSLTSLRSLHFSYIVHENRPFDFNYLITDTNPHAPAFRNALEAQLRSTHLLQVTVPNMRNFPFRAFVDKASLIDLVEDAPFSVELSVVSLKATPEVSLYIPVRRYAVGSISWPRKIPDVSIAGQTCLSPPSVGIPPLDVSVTKSVSICVKEQINVVEAEKVIRCAARGLEELNYEGTFGSFCIWRHCYVELHTTFFNLYFFFFAVKEAPWLCGFAQALLSSSTASASLSLTTLVLSHTSDSDPDPLSYITDELALLSSNPTTSNPTSTTPHPSLTSTLPHLHTLSLSLTLSLTHAPLPAKSLHKLDEVLSDRRRFPCLKELCIDITVIKRGRWDENANRNGTGEEEGASPPILLPLSSSDASVVAVDATRADANRHVSGRTAHVEAVDVQAVDVQEAEEEKEARFVQSLLDDFEAQHRACLPRLTTVSKGRQSHNAGGSLSSAPAPASVELHYTSVLREMYDDEDEDEDDGYMGFEIWEGD